MAASLIDGNRLAQSIQTDLAERIKGLKREKIVPRLAVLIVGDNPASQVYVRKKLRSCAQIGIEPRLIKFPESVSQKDLLEAVDSEGSDLGTHGIIVQLPLPVGLDKYRILDFIPPHKDVDCFTTANLGRLAQNRPAFLPCTPAGVVHILKSIPCNPKGKHVVIINRSLVVGQPLATMLCQDSEWANATVSLCNEHTRNLKDLTRSADILVSAVGRRPAFVLTADMVKPGSAVIDVAINRTDVGIIGDADFEAVREVAGYLTPVPGGCGPLTVAMLLQNTVQAACEALEA